MSDVHLKLHYFNGRGRAELIRFILHYVGKEFEDYRIELADWPKLKSTYPNQQVPVLEITSNGKRYMLSQSLTIARHLAKLNGLAGADMIEEAFCDEVGDSLTEIVNFGATALHEEDADRKQKNLDKLKTIEIPRIFGVIEKRLLINGGEHLIGEKYTWVDFFVAVLFGEFMKRLGPDFETMVRRDYPAMFALQKNVESIPQIADYITKRPVTDF